jgi:hypothetical protein
MIWTASAGALVVLALFVQSSGATRQSPSGDTCTAAGNGDTYTVVITLPSSLSQQGAFAFAAPGAKIKSITAQGMQGSFSTQGLPAGTSGALDLDGAAATPGSSVTAVVTTSGPVTGSFTVVPASSTSSGTQMTYFDPIPCGVSKATTPSNKFTVARRATYDSAAGVWHLAVTISGPGKVSGIELEPTVGTGATATVTAKSLVQTKSKTLESGGAVTLALRPTSRGLAALKAAGSIKAKLSVVFDPKDGKSATKIVSLTLTK